MLRPKDILDELAISPSSLRLWSTRFAELLSPSAQPSQTDKGGAAQRRYSQADLELFRTAQRFLVAGKTYEETRQALQSQEPVPEPPEPPPAHETPVTDLAVIEPIHPVIRAFEEALKAKDQALASKDETIQSLETRAAELAAAKDEAIEALHLAMSSKDNELQTLQTRVEDLSQSLLTAQAAVQLRVEASPSQPRFRWKWLGKLLTGETQDVG